MKGKIPKILSVALALVLMLSLSLVTAAPVLAARVGEPTVTLTTYKVGVAGDYSIAFTTHVELGAGDTISTVFPDGTTMPATIAAANVLVTSEDGGETLAVQGERVDITLNQAISAGAASVAFNAGAAILNPSTAGDYQLQVYTSKETTARTSGDYTVYPRTSNTPASVGVTTDTSAVAGTGSAYTVTLGTGSDGAITNADADTITIDFPAGTTVPGTIATSAVTVGAVEAASVDVSGLKVTIGVPVGGDVGNSANAIVIFALGAGLANPEDADGYTVDAWTSAETVAKTSGTYAITAEAPADITQLDFSTFPSTTAYGTNATIIVQAQDQYGNPVEVSENRTINITTNAGTGSLNDGTLGFPLQVTILSGDSFIAFTYLDTVTGATLTAAVDPSEGVAWTNAVGIFTITPQVALYHGAEPVANYNTIALAIAAAVPGDTIKVGPGTYLENLDIGVADLTLESTGTTAETIIDTSAGTNGIVISADGVAVDGFTVVGNGDTTPGSGYYGIKTSVATSGVTVQNNTVTDVVTAIVFEGGATTSATVSGNLISDCNGGIDFITAATTCTVSNNQVTDCKGPISGGSGIELHASTSSTITGNTVSNGGWGIMIGGDVTTSCVISDNTLTGNRHDGIKIATSLTIAGLSITRNNITANEEDGIFLESWQSGGTSVIQYNNIYGNGLEGDPLVEVAWLYDIENSSGQTVDATYNYWGNTSGPGSNVDSTGTTTTSPWLAKTQADCVTASYPAVSVSLSTGWNTLSTPAKLIGPANAVDELVPSGASMAYYYDGGWQLITGTYVLEPCDAVYIKMTSAETVLFQIDGGINWAPSKDLAAGWNMVGQTKLTGTETDLEAIGSVSSTYSQLVSPCMNSGAEWINTDPSGGTQGSLVLGEGYWIFMKSPGTLAGFTFCPIAPAY